MTVTETDVRSEAGPAPAFEPPEPVVGLAGVLGSGDHKVIGRLWILTSLLFLLVAGVSGAVLGVEKVDVSGIDIIDPDVLGQTFSLHAVTGTFLFLIPLLLGLATYLVPLQVGARSVAFPRAAAAAYWAYLVSGVVVLAAFVGDGGPFGEDSAAVELFVAALVGVLVALTLAAICVVTTVISLRARGMALHRTPLFSWSNLVAGVLMVLTLPVLAGLLVLVYVDHRYGPTFLDGSGGVYARIAWAWSQPSVYLFAIPALGIIGDVVPVAARTRLTLHRVAMGCIGAFAVFSFGAWAMPGFAPDGGPAELTYWNEVPFYLFSFLIVLPTVAFVGLVLDTLRRGRPRFTSPLVWSMGALVLVVAATVAGAVVSVDPFDLLGTTAHASHVHLLLGAVVLAAFGGLAHWSAKLTGSSLPEGPSTAMALGGLLGAALLALPDLVTGFLDQGAGLVGASSDIGTIEALNLVSVIGGGLLVLVALGFIGLVASAFSSAADAADDPWDGHTLEWATTSPPPVGNFAEELPPVRSEAPLYDARYGQEGT